MRSLVRGLSLGLALVAALWTLGPRVDLEPEVSVPPVPARGPRAAADWVQGREARFDDVVAGAEKMVVWADSAAPARTPLSVLYLHGFSATRQEVSPLPENLAAALGANLFLTRPTGHGRGSEAMAEASLEAWLSDALEGMAVAGELGERVVVMGTSTGGSLALWLAAHADVRDRVAALVLISPNLGLPDARAGMLLWPWGGTLARLLEGPERSFEPRNELQERYWTTRYPVEALLPLMATVHTVEETSFRDIPAPVWIAYDPDDTVVDPAVTEARFPEFPSPWKVLRAVEVPEGADPHVLAGDILNPEMTAPLLEEILDFITAAEAGRGGPPAGP